ncbi:AAA family ATPase [Haloferula sp.]|uniref:AAA family ATPase n=1 Tax=Haloferula sp. TaxID=2497595 RepID=UPI003C724537
MKITKIRLQNFRAYDEPFELDLGDGRNLLLHGENGSGKSSLYFALKRFFEERGDDFTRHRNHFSDGTRASEVTIGIKGTDAQGNTHDCEVPWTDADGHPLRPQLAASAAVSPVLRSLMVDAARRSGFLDYRSLLRTNLFAKPIPRESDRFDAHDLLYGAERGGLEAQLFDIATWVILDGVRTTVGGTETTIGTLIRDVWRNRPASRHARRMRSAEWATTRFNEAFAAVLPALEQKTSEFLAQFNGCGVTLSFDPVSISWDKRTLSLDGAILVPSITFRGQVLDDFSGTLNEARLSALAICLFLAGVRLSDNDDQNPAHPRFLFLDDTLIGLELQNRLPILEILTSPEFQNYQIFLLTHDRVWFELARGHLPTNAGWCHHELIGDESTGHLIPKSSPCQADLTIAERHLANNDLKAAAVYARSAFEWKLRNVCEKKGIKLPFKENTAQVGAGALWDGIMERQRERAAAGGRDFVPAQLANRVQTIRTTVLNRLSHTGAHGLVAAEVQAAIDTIRDVHNHPFPNA